MSFNVSVIIDPDMVHLVRGKVAPAVWEWVSAHIGQYDMSKWDIEQAVAFILATHLKVCEQQAQHTANIAAERARALGRKPLPTGFNDRQPGDEDPGVPY